MAVIIQELLAEVLPDTESAGGGEAPHPAEGPSTDKLMDLLDLARERAERLTVD